ncbi:2-hydroxyacid dehydrogenase [Xanthobacteraceae bacterium Astr-EGSB]|nr:2-hydroxyacid dehydrogenase [Xanthobacteraceae bacterium Astr-EGSB]
MTDMANEKPDILIVGAAKPVIVEGLTPHGTIHHLADQQDGTAFVAPLAERIRGIALVQSGRRLTAEFMSLLPRLEIVSNFGVGYDTVDAAWAGQHGIMVTNTPDVLNEEVADTALGLLLCTVRELPQAERYVRAGKWVEKNYPLSQSLRDRTVGVVGMGRIGKAIGRRLEAFGVPVVYHSRHPQAGVAYKYYPDLVGMARDVDVLMVIVPGGAATKHLINAEVLAALGPNGILINMARGSVVDEEALIKALQDKTILTAGLDVFAKEPQVPQELLAMDHVVLFPHLGSGSIHTRKAMDQLTADNLVSWFAGKGPITPVPETPWPRKG